MDQRKQDVVTALVSRMLTYALGRELELTDKSTVDGIVQATAVNDYRLKEIIHQIVLSEPFRTK